MRNIVLFGVSLFVLIGFMGKLAPIFGVRSAKPPQTVQAAAPAAAKPQQSSNGSAMMAVARDRNGHFSVDGVIGGRRVSFLVDTGASVVALTESDAQRLNITSSKRDPVAMLQTANGIVHVKRVRLAQIDIGGLTVQDVDAVIMPPGRLDQSLLGMSFLSRLRRYEFRSGALVMEQ